MTKVSIIIPFYGTENKLNLEKCIRSVLEQTHKNIEILIVGKYSEKIVDTMIIKVISEDERVKIIENASNNLTKMIVSGIKNATGEYISIINSEDYIDKDYYRMQINDIDNNKSDISISNIVNDDKGKKYIYTLQYNSNNALYDGRDFFNVYFEQIGRNNRYHSLYNKIIKKYIWDKIIKYIENRNESMCEDIVISTLAFNYSKKVSFNDNTYYFKIIKEDNDSKIIEINNKIDKINNTFKILSEYINNELDNEKLINYLKKWRIVYISKEVDKYKKIKLIDKKIDNLEYDYENDKDLNDYYQIKEKDNSWDNYNSIETEFDEGFCDIKNMIINPEIKVVSFDMFDTLVIRPFFLPHEMFYLLNKKFIELFNPIKAVDFSIIRRKSENELRAIYHKKNIDEITLEQIYQFIEKTYNLDKEKIKELKETEEEMEKYFCKRRNSGFELYSLAKHLGKKVILASDIYLSKKVIKEILKNAGYEFDKIYISSELLKTKSSGTMYEHIIEKEKTTNILHIGDNYETDYNRAQEYGIKSMHLPKSTYTMMGYTGKNVGYCGNLYRKFMLFNQDHISYEENYGVRCSLGMIANYYFDNPFKSFNIKTEFNGDPYFIGYYALGMQMISMCKWLLEDAKENNINSIVFMSRDGYIPYEAVKKYTKNLKEYTDIKLKYIYVSRKALMPLLLKEKNGISLIETYVNYDMLTPKDLIEQLNVVLATSTKKEKEIDKEFELGKKFDNLSDFNNCLSLIYDKCFDAKKYDEYFEICRQYFNENFIGNTATFDIGYSGKPEAIISSVIGKPIRTYFIHANNSQAYCNTRNCNSKLVTFFDYKPTITGTIRELLISDIGPSCIGYKKEDNIIKPIFKECEKYNYYNIDMINKIQKGSLDFIENFCDCFKNYINEIDLNKYYMSLPLEYYFHYTNKLDKIPTKDLIFENNVNNYVELNDYIFKKYEEYSSEYSLGSIPKKIETTSINYSLPNNRIKRIFHYIIKDRNELKNKWYQWKNKKNDPNLLPKSRAKRIIYYLVFDQRKLFKKVSNK